jgi:hypothetical protein
METALPPAKKRPKGRPRNESNHAKMFKQYVGSLTYSQCSVFLARLQLELEIKRGDLKRLYTSEAYHTAPNRAKICEIAGCNIYSNGNTEQE